MANQPKPTPAPADAAEGAGTTPESTPEVAAAPDAKDAQIAALEAKLAAAEAKVTLGQIQAAQTPTPAPATFAAPSAPLIGKHDSATGLVQQLPAKLWDVLSDEDKARFTDVVEQPAKLATHE